MVRRVEDLLTPPPIGAPCGRLVPADRRAARTCATTLSVSLRLPHGFPLRTPSQPEADNLVGCRELCRASEHHVRCQPTDLALTVSIPHPQI
jgi:hypothetical protein